MKYVLTAEDNNLTIDNSWLTFDEYVAMGGIVPDENSYYSLEFEAEQQINYYTFDRLRNDDKLPMEVKMCIYKLVDIVNTQIQSITLGQNTEGNETSAISSQSNDGISVSYNVLSASQAYDIAGKEIELTIKRYLSGVRNQAGKKLLYRGVYPDE